MSAEKVIKIDKTARKKDRKQSKSEPIVKINGVPMSQIIKEHIVRNKTHYLWGSAMLITVTTTGVVAYMLGKDAGAEEVKMIARQINILSKDNVLLQVVIKPGNSGDVLWDPTNKVAYLSKNEAARKLGVTLKTIQKKISDGDLEMVIDGSEGLVPVAV